jgi:hypothetical protein
MNEELLQIIGDFTHFSTFTAEERTRALERVQDYATAPPDEFASLCAALVQVDAEELAKAAELFSAWMKNILRSRRKNRLVSASPWLRADLPRHLAALYQHLPDSFSLRGRLLECLATGGTQEELQLLVGLLEHAPPATEEAIDAALVPLFQFNDYEVTHLFPSLLNCLAQPRLTASVLDLANYLTRQQRVKEHPARERRTELMALLGELTQRMQRLEEHPERHVASATELSKTVAHGVALAVSLCDALALIGDAEASPKLYQAMELRHRRIRTEAAGALARLGEKTGREELLKLASEPVARLRVLAYAEELGLLDQVEAEYQTPAARAEAEMVLWLSAPQQYGLPPVSCELLDHRTQYWPSYEEPRDCYLFRYEYRFEGEAGPTSFSNVGIVGPLVKTMQADLTELPLEDVYALFAGWHVEHDDIFEVQANLLNETQRIELVRFERRLKDDGCDQIRPLLLCYFFAEKSLVAQVRREGQTGIALAAADETLFFPKQHARSLGADEILHLYRGRKLLREFNA